MVTKRYPGERNVTLPSRVQQRRERRGSARRRAPLDLALVRLDELVYDREPEAGAVGARREEGLEDARQVRCLDAAAGVGDLDGDAAVGGVGGAHRHRAA